MNRVYRGPFGALLNEVGTMQDEFVKLFGRGGQTAGPVGLHLNAWEDEQAIFVEADLPGVDPAKIDVTVTEGNHLAIRAERTAPEVVGAKWIRQERGSGEFLRELTLPSLVNADAVQAKYESGVLKLTLPKHDAVKPRKINVTVSQ